ncbi:saccharopine dehydrogenase [Anaeramoeba flamelloides]|uniref:Saccharopine dehydrogenase n=1 Tax=Anaeramoeba flamelloides TaxID=1746091 RepID=A0ABQ8Z7W7_9EUKA|nr:saccharopine dehydrogenase [Anaeramoeba flamelloides]
MSTIKILVIGGGMQGKNIAKDLAQESTYKVTVADINESIAEELEKFGISYAPLDLRNLESLKKLVEPFDFVCGAVPSKFGRDMLKTVIECGKSVCDISFTPTDLSDLSSLAEKHNVTVLVDFGIAPGMSHVIVGKSLREYESIETAKIYVGGLPQKEYRRKPYEYFSVFCVEDVIEEYTRTARQIINNEVVEIVPLSKIEPFETEYEEIGSLETFYSDGLRSLLKSASSIKNLTEQTFRYPGHLQLIKKLNDENAFEGEKREKTIKQIEKDWQPQEGDKDLLVMSFEFDGVLKGEKEKTITTYNLLDKYDEVKNVSSMARTTAYTCAIGLRLIINGLFTPKGLFYPEEIALRQSENNECTDYLFEQLEKRNINFIKK